MTKMDDSDETEVIHEILQRHGSSLTKKNPKDNDKNSNQNDSDASASQSNTSINSDDDLNTNNSKKNLTPQSTDAAQKEAKELVDKYYQEVIPPQPRKELRLIRSNGKKVVKAELNVRAVCRQISETLSK